MAAESSTAQSNMPLHVRPFLRPSFTTEPLSAQPPYSYAVAHRTKTPELCPPHWRRDPRPGFRSTLKGIILKDIGSYPFRSSSSPKRPSSEQGTVMRMKDSDDYITARAANPRTGLISPSVGSPSLRPPVTPDSPADALQRKSGEIPESPTLDVKARPALRRAHVSKKPNPRNVQAWVVDNHGWLTNVSTASPRVTAVDADAGLYLNKRPNKISEDAFVVHMPSAREPQPYAYPGYSARQIAAFEHYQKKARQASGEVYDKRINNRRQEANDKSRMSSQQIRDALEAEPATFAPYSAPRTPHGRVAGIADTAVETISQPRKYDHHIVRPMSRKPVHQIHRQRDQNVQVTQGVSPSKPASTTPPPQPDLDLHNLPRVRLLHPSLASTTPHRAHDHSALNSGHRQCSLGCLRDAHTNLCVQPRLASSDSVTSLRRVLFDDAVAQPSLQGTFTNFKSQSGSLLVEILVIGIIGMASIGNQVRMPALPRFCALETLSARSATPREKANALKVVVTTTGQAVLFLVLVTLVWQIGTAVMRCLQLLCWPLLIPFKILRWVCLGF